MALVTNNRISWEQFTQLLTPTDPVKAETIFDQFEADKELAVAKQIQAGNANPNQNVTLALVVKNYIRNIDFGSLYTDGKIDLSKLNQIAADKKRISHFLESIVLRLGASKDLGYVADQVNSALRSKIFIFHKTVSAVPQIASEVTKRATTLANKLFQAPLINTAHTSKTTDAAKDKSEKFIMWLVNAETKATLVAFQIMKAQIQDDETVQDDRLDITQAERLAHPTINFDRLRNVPVSLIREWLEITDTLIRPLNELEAKADSLKTPTNVLEWNNTYNTVNGWVKNVQDQKAPVRERPVSMSLEMSRLVKYDEFLDSPETPMARPNSDNGGISLTFLAGSMTIEMVRELGNERKPPELSLPKATDLVKPYVLKTVMTQRKTLEHAINALCDDKDPYHDAAVALGVPLESETAPLDDREKKFAQRTLLPSVDQKIVKDVVTAFKTQRKTILEDATTDFETRFAGKGNVTNIGNILESTLAIHENLIQKFMEIKTIKDFETVVLLRNTFENSFMAPLYKDAMASRIIDDARLIRWNEKLQTFKAHLS